MPVFTRSRDLPDSSDDGTPASADDTEAAGEPEAAPSGAPESDTPPRTLGSRVAHWRAWRGRYPRAARAVWWTTTALSLALVLGAMVMPNQLHLLRADQFVRLPGEAIIAAALLLSLPRRPRLVAAAALGAGLAALTVVNVLDMMYAEYLGRGFNLVLDWGLLDDAQSYVADSMGGATALGATAGLLLLIVALFAAMALAAVRLSNLLVRDVSASTRGTLIAGTVWITCSVLSIQYAGLPLAFHRAVTATAVKAKAVRQTLQDEAAFAKENRADAFGNTPPEQLVPDLRGKDVIFTFIESYGRSAIEDPVMAPGVNRTLTASTDALTKAGYHARSGWLTSATFGGSSWLGHSTTLSGLWIDNQQRYRTVMNSDRLSLPKIFKKTGAWDTVGVMPGIQKAWPEQKHYGLDKVYNAFQMGYQGPKFSWSTMPDQYALEAFQRLEHGKDRDRPLMSEIILTSSHQPWAPLPEMVGWDEVGDGSVFDSIQKAGEKASDVISNSARSRKAYGESIEYSVTALTQWLERYGTEDTVLVFLGDHQPIARVSGDDASRDVPVSIVAKDPKVLDKVASWNWTDGLRPAKDAPVWKMDLFRDRFLTAYGSTPHPSK
ncbi:CDP-alcohol phosphatidyltransferase [Streptomyces phaeoluteigriseus]|uniref:CDP-alcohol phosphatidyltransferase n=1 Tax=Streptomyces phaeoluteigriseus TaxID=114686 RepID=A0ABY4ZH70_9ACTN|nr:CDP-alcohol phosphatidyltransferase [Streptomyces phaeoluteigriseus]USQ88204.1 CDP-alcohol phosphatidyltransferase [Streptomyces phaeoluteigriseus]